LPLNANFKKAPVDIQRYLPGKLVVGVKLYLPLNANFKKAPVDIQRYLPGKLVVGVKLINA
jgi:hypothetical protein